MGVQRSGRATEFQGGGGSPAIGGGFPVFLHHGGKKGSLDSEGVDTENGRRMGITGERSLAAVAAPTLVQKGFSSKPEWTMGFVWDEDSVMRT
jgi:hypothetical protein